MTSPAAVTADLAGQLAVLARALEALGLETKALTGSRRPGLQVTNPKFTWLSEVIYAARSRDGQAWCWWSWGEQIDAITNTRAAASVIARVLALPDYAPAHH